MQPDTMGIDQARELLSEEFDRPIDEVSTDELENLYEETAEGAREAAYKEEHEDLLQALTLELDNRKEAEKE